MPVNLSQIRDLLLPGLNKVFGDYEKLPREWSEIFTDYKSDMAYERDVEMKLTGLAQLRTEGSSVNFDDLGERFVSVYHHIEVALGFVMTDRAIKDNLYKSQFGPNAKALRNSVMQAEEVYGANVLNNAFNTNNLGGDGVPLASTAHPTDVGTYANTPTIQAQLNETSLNDAFTAIGNYTDQAGLRIKTNFRKLVVPVAQEWNAYRLFNSPMRPGTADNDLNPLAGSGPGAMPGGVVTNHYINSPNFWMILTDAPEGLKHFTRDPLSSDMFTDFLTDNLMVKARKRFSFGWSNPRAVWISQA